MCKLENFALFGIRIFGRKVNDANKKRRLDNVNKVVYKKVGKDIKKAKREGKRINGSQRFKIYKKQEVDNIIRKHEIVDDALKKF